MMKTVNISSHKVEANDSLITGSNNIIFGNNNKIVGDNNKIYGNSNAIVGNGNVVKGENNSAKGTNNDLNDPFHNASPTSSFASGASSFNTTPSFFSSPSITEAFNSSPAPAPTNDTFFPPVQQPFSQPVQPSNNDMYFSPVQQPFAQPQPVQQTFAQPQPVQPFPVRQASSPTPFASPSYAAAPSYPSAASPVNFNYNSPNTGNMYFQPVQPVGTPVVVVPTLLAPQPVATYMALSPRPSASSNGEYVNPFSPPASPTPFSTPSANPFEKKEKAVDIIQDGTLVFIVNETESEYVREFCKLISNNSGQKVGCHISAGRMCIVGLGDLDKIRSEILQQLPLLNLKLKEWSWNTFGKNVCNDKDVYFKRLFKEYTREDVDCWRDKPTKIAA